MFDSTDLVVGRQGIYSHEDVIGYELLFRSTHDAPRPGGDQMTAQVLFGAVNIGMDRLVSDRCAFINADRGVLLGNVPIMLPPHRTIVEVLETVEVDDEIVAGARRLRAAGFRLALDDFVMGAGQDALLPLASIVKIDLTVAQPHDLADVVAYCRQHQVRMLAERVESLDDVPRLTELGFELFQGYAFERPRIVAGRALNPTDVSGLSAASDVLSVGDDFDALEQIVRRDPALAHQVLQLASIGRLGETRRRVSTIREALVLAGAMRIRNWTALLLARPPGDSAIDRDTFVRTLQRARVCELLGRMISPKQAELAFAAGMISAFDLLFSVPLDDVDDAMQLSAELREAAFGGTSALAVVVEDARSYQLGTLDGRPRCGLPIEEFDSAFSAAFTWATEAAGATVSETQSLSA